RVALDDRLLTGKRALGPPILVDAGELGAAMPAEPLPGVPVGADRGAGLPRLRQLAFGLSADSLGPDLVAKQPGSVRVCISAARVERDTVRIRGVLPGDPAVAD